MGQNNPAGRILIVDDDKSLLRTLQLLLKDEIGVVNTVSNPNGIPNELATGNYDVVLLDMNFSAGIQTGNTTLKRDQVN